MRRYPLISTNGAGETGENTIRHNEVKPLLDEFVKSAGEKGLPGEEFSSWVIMGFIILFFLVRGCFVDALALIMLTIPILVTLVFAALILMLTPSISLWLPNLGG